MIRAGGPDLLAIGRECYSKCYLELVEQISVVDKQTGSDGIYKPSTHN